MIAWLSGIWDAFCSMGVGDILDVAVVATLLYLVLLWFKRTKAAFVARGILIFLIIYAIAQQAGMILTSWMFHGFFTIFLIALVVIFQEELRSFFERIAVWSLRRPTSHPLQSREVEILVRVLGELAKAYIGALIVLKGRDPLERHIEGGQDLNGELSEPLLHSLFDPHSIGHDGAVVIDEGRVVSFGAHLPLSREFYKLAGVGTRHTAALGLSERVDSLCLVVSEERGTISIAKDGEITVIQNLMTLEQHIAEFLKAKAPVRARAAWRDAVRRNWFEKMVAIVFAMILWLVFVQDLRPERRVFAVPVQGTALPEDMEVKSSHPGSVQVTLQGLRRDFKLLNPLALRIYVDMKEAEPGAMRIPVGTDQLSIPPALQMVKVDPLAVEFVVVSTSEASKSLLDLFGLTSSKEGAGKKVEGSSPEAEDP